MKKQLQKSREGEIDLKHISFLYLVSKIINIHSSTFLPPSFSSQTPQDNKKGLEK